MAYPSNTLLLCWFDLLAPARWFAPNIENRIDYFQHEASLLFSHRRNKSTPNIYP